MANVTPILLAVGTTHSLNIAGIGLDARIAPVVDVRVVSIVAGVSAQNATTVLARMPVDEAIIAAQFAAVRDLPIGAIHVGALLDARSVAAVAQGLRQRAKVPVVCDPVIAATGGDRLADDAGVAALRADLFPLCTLVTPNLDEASRLLGHPITDLAGMEQGALQLREAGATAVLVKGGHLAGNPSDVLVWSGGMHRFSAPRISGTLRGTGDLLACAIAARLAHGDTMIPAIEAARAFVRGCLAAAVPFAGTYTVP